MAARARNSVRGDGKRQRSTMADEEVDPAALAGEGEEVDEVCAAAFFGGLQSSYGRQPLSVCGGH